MILAVTGGKGGVGKSTVAFNLAATLEAVVVDGDLGMADLPSGEGPDLHDVLAGRATPVEAVREDGPVAILPCGRTLSGLRGCEPAALVDALAAVERAYGRVVVDCPAGMSGDVGLGLAAADACLLVTTASPPALGDALRARALARELDAGLLRVVVNRVADAVPTDRIARTLGAPVTTLPDSQVVAAANRAGAPVTTVAPESRAADAFAALATAARTELAGQ